jgi:Glycosyltransferase sugar-binding region containing DXD motif
MIPNILHFVFGMAADFGGMPFSLVHYLSIKSAVIVNRPDIVYFHYQYEPEGEWWLKAKELVTLKKITAPKNFLGNELCHVAHKADVVRLQVLKETGGIYLDLDTISIRPLTDLLEYSFAIGQELKAAYTPKNFRQRVKNTFYKQFGMEKDITAESTGLCNAVLLSEKNGHFVNKWLDAYKTFRSQGRDKYWNEHSVQVPLKLAEDYPESITKISHTAFYYPLYDERGLRSMFEEVNEFPEAYLYHLWESFSWDKYLSRLTPEEIKIKDTTYNLIARQFL